MQGGRFRSWNRGERSGLPHRSEQFDSGAPSTPTGQSQLWKLHFGNQRNRAGVDSASFENCTLSIGRGDGTNGSRRAEVEAVSYSVFVLGLRRRLRRSPGLGHLPPQMSAYVHSGKDAQPAPERLPLLCGVGRRRQLHRRPAIRRWVPYVGASHPALSPSGSCLGQDPAGEASPLAPESAFQCQQSRSRT